MWRPNVEETDLTKHRILHLVQIREILTHEQMFTFFIVVYIFPSPAHTGFSLKSRFAEQGARLLLRTAAKRESETRLDDALNDSKTN